jgi:hypothetical protein
MNRTTAPYLLLLLLSGLTSCGGEGGDEPADGITLLSPREQLIRLSVDLRGVHPSEAELAAIDENPDLYDDFVGRFQEDPRMLGRMREIWNLRFMTRTGTTYFDPAEAGLSGSSAAIAGSLANEPLMLLSRIIEEDLPYSEIVEADYTMADGAVAAMWDLEYPEGETGWQVAHYQDGRPEAGILTMSTLWQRYPSMGGNANRHRANAISKMLLCDDYLSRPIVLNRAAVDQLTVDPEDAIATNASCQSCHSTLAPLSAHFFGFFNEEEVESLRDGVTYRAENEQNWRDYAGRAPAYYGRPTTGIPELAERIAKDPRFEQCAVQTAWEGLTQRELSSADWAELQAHTLTFQEKGQRLKPLIEEIVTARVYRAGEITDPDLAMRAPVVKTASPAQLASIIEDITGYRMTFSAVDGLTDPSIGIAVLSGGIDGAFVTRPSFDPSVGGVFVLERLAQSAAWDVVSHDFAPGRTEPARLLAYVTLEDTPESNPTAFDGQLRALYLRVTGLPLSDDAPEPGEMMRLWREIADLEGSHEAAWAAVLSVILRDPRVLFY